MSITTDNLAEFVDRLADLKRALAQLNDAGTADRHLIGLETVANAAPLVQLLVELFARVWLCGSSKAGTRLLRVPRSHSLHGV